MSAPFDIKQISLGDLRRYLILKGWNASSARNADVYTSSSPDLDGLELILPREITTPSSAALVEQVVRVMSEIEDREVPAVIYAIRTVSADIVRSRLPDAIVLHDAIHLDTAVNFMKNMKNLLAASATSELNPMRFFSRAKKEAITFAGSCRFGHTFRGSFGFSIESPVSQNLQLTIPGLDNPPPFERRVIERVAVGLRTLQSAVETEDARKITDGFQQGLSANMCDDLVAAVEAVSGQAVDLEISFSPEWQVSHTAPTEAFRIRPQHIEMAKEGAKLLRQQEVFGVKTIIGSVSILRSDGNPSDLANPEGSREVTIQWKSDDFGTINVKVLLSPDRYLAALDAHKQGQWFEARGPLEHHGKKWVLKADL